MFGSFLQPHFMPCPECGASVPAAELDEHVCAHDRWLDYQLFRLRAEVASFDVQLAAYLLSPEGQFEAFYAERERIRALAVI
jgi:hypothetical protein